MSLIQRITTRRIDDVINEGAKVALTGGLSSGTDQVVFVAADTRAPIITGFSISTNSGTAILVSIGFKNGVEDTLEFYRGYIGGGQTSVDKVFQLGDWYRGRLGDSIVISTAGTVAYTVDARITSEPAALGYIEQEYGHGADGHRAKAVFPGENRHGQSEV